MNSLMEKRVKRWKIVGGRSEPVEVYSLKEVKEVILPLAETVTMLRGQLKRVERELEHWIKMKWALEEEEILREKKKPERKGKKRKFSPEQLHVMSTKLRLSPEEFEFLRNR